MWNIQASNTYNPPLVLQYSKPVKIKLTCNTYISILFKWNSGRCKSETDSEPCVFKISYDGTFEISVALKVKPILTAVYLTYPMMELWNFGGSKSRTDSHRCVF